MAESAKRKRSSVNYKELQMNLSDDDFSDGDGDFVESKKVKKVTKGNKEPPKNTSSKSTCEIHFKVYFKNHFQHESRSLNRNAPVNPCETNDGGFSDLCLHSHSKPLVRCF